MKKILIATHSKGKFPEIKKILKGLPFKIVNLDDVGIDFEIEETGSTFRENAILKARAYGKITGLLTLAEDAGLEVNVLNGAPGVYSARYCPGTDEDRYKLLLRNLRGVPAKKRTARFKAVVAIFDPKSKKVRTFQETLEGRITFEPKGEHGFGYDPIFYVLQLRKRTAELTAEEKNKISHRGKAWRKARKILELF
jgi:XTP/dITP diphosphohydrolase